MNRKNIHSENLVVRSKQKHIFWKNRKKNVSEIFFNVIVSARNLFLWVILLGYHLFSKGWFSLAQNNCYFFSLCNITMITVTKIYLNQHFKAKN